MLNFSILNWLAKLRNIILVETFMRLCSRYQVIVEYGEEVTIDKMTMLAEKVKQVCTPYINSF